MLALDQVTISLNRGEVLALVGENGAGKSTLLKILSGAYTKDEGVIEYDGKVIEGYTPNEAIDMGISIIYQELDNYGTLTVAENILVNAMPKKNGKFSPIDWKEAYKRADEIIRQITDEIDVTAKVSTLTAAQQQLVEIAKAMSRGAINNLIKSLGQSPIAFLQDPKWFWVIIIVTCIWKELGWNTIIYLAALSGIDAEQYEAALVDGANGRQRLWHITIPRIN